MAGQDENSGKRNKKGQAGASAVAGAPVAKRTSEGRPAAKERAGKTTATAKSEASGKGAAVKGETAQSRRSKDGRENDGNSNRAMSDDSGTVRQDGGDGKRSVFDIFSNAVSAGAGKPATFVAAVIFIILWGASGPFFGFSETWQLVVNTGTTIITFLMVFVLQNSQNRDSEAVQTKLDELILSSHAANEFAGIEKLDEKQLKRLSESLHRHSQRLGKKAEEMSSANGR
jgi:low affinity Fe/Cu permease